MAKLKRKGSFEHAPPGERNPAGWHQNLSAMVVPKAAEAYLVHGTPIRQFIYHHQDIMDFMLRTKVPRNSHLLLGDQPYQRITRYLVTNTGGELMKVSPPPEGCMVGQWKRANGLTDWFYNEEMNNNRDCPMCFAPWTGCSHSVELDSTGRPWDERINTKNKSMYGERRLGIDVGWLVTPFNRIDGQIDRDQINFEYYIAETGKLTDQLKVMV